MQLLNSLRDVDGVFGSFLLSPSGALIGKDLPSLFGDEVFVDTGRRLLHLCETLEYCGGALEGAALHFSDYRLHIRRSQTGLLCVIASRAANPPALKMALSLVLRRLAGGESSIQIGPQTAPTRR